MQVRMPDTAASLRFRTRTSMLKDRSRPELSLYSGDYAGYELVPLR